MLIGFGLLVSIPLIVAGATLIMSVLHRFPILVWAGAGLLGWIAGQLLIEDPVSRPILDGLGMSYGLDHKGTEIVTQIACTLFVLLCGWLLLKWRNRRPAGGSGAEEPRRIARGALRICNARSDLAAARQFFSR